MSVGGTVVETVDTGAKVWVNTTEVRGSSQTCAIYVERTAQARSISDGDGFWWQGLHAFWTPRNRKGEAYAAKDIKLNRIGFSGVSRPVSEKAAA